METLKRFWFYISTTLLVILSLVFFYQRKKNRDLQTDLLNTKIEKDNAILNVKIDESNKSLQDAKRKLEEELGRELTDEELLKRLTKI